MLIVVLILVFMPFAAADPLGKICTSGNYTANSTYQANLEHLSTILPKNTSSAPTLFVKDSLGAAPDTVYGLALCFGDADDSACDDCVTVAFQDAKRLCAYNKDVTVFYDHCILRFSNWNFFHPADYTGENFLWVPNTHNITGWDPGDAKRVITLLAQRTANLAAYNNSRRMYATVRMDVTSPILMLFSMAQCTPDMSPSDCRDCLQGATTTIASGGQGGRNCSLWCNFRYEMYRFYQGQPMLHIDSSGTVVPPPPPPPVAVPIQKHKRRMSKVLVIATAVLLLASFFFFIFCFGLIRKHRRGKVSLQDKPNMNVYEDEALVWGIEARNSEFTFFNISQLSDATSNFSHENKLGQGGFGPVYKGQLPDGLEIAIKRLASHSGQGFTEFKNEVQLIAKLQHTNLVRLLGCCSQGEEKILIYEYLPNKSLDFFIFDETRRALLNWNKCIAIIEGIAQGLLYLHKHSRLRVIHRDLKASNILLDGEMNPKISDFGLAKIFSSNDTEGNTKRVVGTYGYMSPEYASEGIFSIKSDVFSFGVLILEIISGKRNSGFHQYGNFFNLLGHAWKMWKEERLLEFVDASLISEFHALETMRCVNMALLCVQENAADRPTMSDVVAMLSSESMTLPEPKHPAYFHIRVASIVTESSSVNDVTMSVLRGR